MNLVCETGGRQPQNEERFLFASLRLGWQPRLEDKNGAPAGVPVSLGHSLRSAY
jgi:hypothetical protein